MKILQIGKFFPPYYFGGIETFSKNLHNALIEKGIDINFIGFLPKNYKEDIYVDNRIKLFKTNIDLCSTQFSNSFVNFYKKHRNEYDLILVNVPHPFANLVLWLYPPKKNTKVILYWHSDIIKQRFILFFYKPLLKWLIKKSSLITAPTEVHLDESDFTKLFEGKKKCLPFLLDYNLYKSEFKTTEDGKKIIFSCGRLTHYKGFEILIQAAQYISDDAVIYIAGTGKLQNRLEESIKNLNLKSKVKLLGHISEEELAKQYQNCYLFCFPSINRAEMMGFVQYEAFSYGKPVISTTIPRSGAPTINQEGISGYKVNINDPKALAERINYVLENDSKYNELCDGAFELACKYNDKEIVNLYIDCFNKVVNNVY